MKGNTMYRKRIPAVGKNVNAIEVRLDYSLGGNNVWTGNNEPRGYYIYVTPCEIVNECGYSTCSYILGQGYRECILSVARKSDKAANKAKEIAPSHVKNLVLKTCREYSISIEDDDLSKLWLS